MTFQLCSMSQWYLIKNKMEHTKAKHRFEEILDAKNGSQEFKEMRLLAYLFSEYKKNSGTCRKLTQWN
jgi:hypothetical protein